MIPVRLLVSASGAHGPSHLRTLPPHGHAGEAQLSAVAELKRGGWDGGWRGWGGGEGAGL